VSRVSLIIPCYRDAATIARALESVYRQTRPVDEVIVVIDCSPETEEVERVLRAFPQVLLVKHAVNLGLAATRNTGVEAATGDIVTFLDADDELHPQKVELQLHVLGPNTAVACAVRRIWPGKPVGEPPLYERAGAVQTVTATGKMLLTNFLTGASLMIQKDLMLKMGGYDSSLRSCEDYDLWLRLIESGVTVRNVQLPLYYYHLNERGLSRDVVNVSYWELEVIKRYYARGQGEFLRSFRDRYIWAWWMLKHLARLEQTQNETLRRRTVSNIELLGRCSLLVWALKAVGRTHLLRPYVHLKSS
jgi:glycosyltransferase involved in cell wall biosynthesis